MISLCQSCGIYITETTRGTESDGNLSEEYCSRCYMNGSFTSDSSMAEVIDSSVVVMMEDQNIPESAARAVLSCTLPRLKRWS